MSDQMWKASHREAHENFLAGRKPWRVPANVSHRREMEHEAALAQRGERAAKAAGTWNNGASYGLVSGTGERQHG